VPLEGLPTNAVVKLVCTLRGGANSKVPVQMRNAPAHPRIEALVNDAKQALQNGRLGGLEGMGVLLRLASLDTDGNNRITDDEAREFEVVGSRLAEETSSYLLNIGVVAALLLSTFAEASFETPGDEAGFVVEVLYMISIHLVLAVSLATLYVSSRMWIHINSFLSTGIDRVWYIRSQQTVYMWLSIGQIASAISASLCLLFGSLCASGWLGLCGLLAPVCFMGAWCYEFGLGNCFPAACRFGITVQLETRLNEIREAALQEAQKGRV